jgi:hypothetical protein
VDQVTINELIWTSDVTRSLFKIAFVAAVLVSTGGWIWLLGVGIRWLIATL